MRLHKRCELVIIVAAPSWSLARVCVRGRDRMGHSASRLRYEWDSGQRASNGYCLAKVGMVGQSASNGTKVKCLSWRTTSRALSFCRLWPQSAGGLLNASARQKSNSVTVTYLLWCLLCAHCFSSELCIVCIQQCIITSKYTSTIYWAASGVSFLPCVQV